MSLRPIVRALGGDLYQGGARANVPAPGHSPADRSVSLVLSGRRVVIHSFGAATWIEVRDDLHRRGLIDFDGRSRNGGGQIVAVRPHVRQRVETARHLWSGGIALQARGVVVPYLRSRRVVWPSACSALLEHPRAPFSVYRPGSRCGRAMMAGVRTPEGALTAVELTYLSSGGRPAVGLRLPRKTVGLVPPGSAVRLFPQAVRMLVAEGVVTTLSASARFDLPGWALMSAGNLAQWRPPAGVRQVVIAADRGRAGETAASRLQTALEARGLDTAVHLPPEPWGDWNEAASGAGKEEGSGRTPVWRGWTPSSAGETP